MDEKRLIDAYFVLAAQAGDKTAIETLVRRWQPKLLAHAWRLSGDREAARDAVQDAWREILSGISHLRDAHAFPAWAYRIVSRTHARQVGHAIRRRKLAVALAAEPLESAEAPDKDESDLRRLQIAIRQLPAEQRAAIALFYFEDLSVAEVAVAMNIPIGTAKTRLMHARRKLHAILEGEPHAQH